MSDVLNQAAMSSMQRRISDVENLTARIGSMVEDVNKNITAMNSSLSTIQTDLNKLSQDFLKMFNEQQRLAALQQATTELVRVRQELEQNFGNYRNVRETMLGVLQASDLALVKKTTISRVSEEIMLSTPEYWLAPCLVAVAAWIANDRDLADRAIAEACNRDEEKTAITMALICRRNNRTQTCYEWLSIYFAKQNAADFSERSFAYIDAYVNGIFGPDERHMCDDYIAKWLNEIKGNNSEFESRQEDIWRTYCERFKIDVSEQYPALATNISEFPQVNEYIGRITSVNSISDNFHGIVNAYVDPETLKKRVDKNLISLIGRYDGKEEPLRNEERFLQKIKDFNGDTEKAREYMRAEEKLKREQRLNLVERMANVIISEEETSPSQKKTAVSFLSGYIKKGFSTYIDEKKAAFPTEITVNVDGWTGRTTDGSNTPQLMADYTQYISEIMQRDINAAKNAKPTLFMVLAIVMGVLSLALLFFAWPIAIVTLIAGVAFVISMFTAKKSIESNIININNHYSGVIANGKAVIASTMTDWKRARDLVSEFEQEPIKEIIA